MRLIVILATTKPGSRSFCIARQLPRSSAIRLQCVLLGLLWASSSSPGQTELLSAVSCFLCGTRKGRSGNELFPPYFGPLCTSYCPTLLLYSVICTKLLQPTQCDTTRVLVYTLDLFSVGSTLLWECTVYGWQVGLGNAL